MKDKKECLAALALLVGVGALEALLLRVAGSPSGHLRVLADLANPMAEPLEATLAALALAAEGIAGYLVLTLALRTSSHLPGFVGQAANHAERLLTVPAIRRGIDALLGGALIAQLAFAPVSTGTGIGTGQPLPPAVATADTITDHNPRMGPIYLPRGPLTSRKSSASASTVAPPPIPLPIWLGGIPRRGSAPSRSRPRDLAAGPAPRVAAHRASSAQPSPGTGSPAPANTTGELSPPAPGPADAHHTIEPGDTLWSIAAAHLPIGARVAVNIVSYWRRIYGANRGVIGPDPDRIQPGVTLSVPRYPTSAPASSSSSARRAAPAWPRSGGPTEDLPQQQP
jgi:nucleoid-associated protein YgaU